jgi:hypothetical protein
VDNFAPKFGLLPVLRDNLAERRTCLLWPLLVLLFLGLIGGSAAAATNLQNPAPASLGPTSQFAIADFDGDNRPDSARIQPGQTSGSGTNYWIQLQLSAVGHQLIQLVAPAGGLSIEARDVNGDHAIDLVLSTAWLKQPVAILLNDGHGSFTRVEPEAFPKAFSESRTSSISTPNLRTEAVGVPPQSRSSIYAEKTSSRHGGSAAGFASRSNTLFAIGASLVSPPGRAPPSAVSYL